ncbi:MAG: AraC family transcriptional regulator [Amaricoccus sp.]
MRPYLEHLQPPSDASWSMLNRRLDDAIPFQWHHHPELELTLTLNSAGQRFVGDHVGSYTHGDLVLVGPNLPHTWASRGKLDASRPHVALVFWFRREWLEAALAGSVEMQPVRDLLDRSAGGLAFASETGLALAGTCEEIFDLAPMPRLLALIGILCRLAEDGSARPLSGIVPRHVGGSRSRLDRVLVHLHEHYADQVSLPELAAVAALSVSGLHRMFVKHTRTSLSEYLAGLRIGDACSRLSASDQPIRHVAEAVGYQSLANFNRQFKALRGMTPRAYRARFRGEKPRGASARETRPRAAV